MYLMKYFIVKKENRNEKKIETKFNSEKLISFVDKISFNPNKDTAPNVGIDNKKEILAESNLL